MRGAAISLTSQNHDDVGRFGRVNNENLSGIARKYGQAGKHD
jgi:hypothetical protein